MNIRIPAALREMLERAAKASGRSLTVELVHRLDASFPENLDALLLKRRQEEQVLIENQLAELHWLAEQIANVGDQVEMQRVTAQISRLNEYAQMIHNDALQLALNINKHQKAIKAARAGK